MHSGLTTLDAMMQQAVEHHQARRLGDAESLYRRVLSIQPNHRDALHLLGVLAFDVGRSDISVDLIGRAIAIDSNVADYHTNLANALQGLGRVDEAIAALRFALTLDPVLPEAWVNLANMLRESHRPDEAIRAAEHALSLRPDWPLALNSLGSALHSSSKYNQAIVQFQRAIAHKPDWALPHYNLGMTLLLTGELEQGWRQCEWRHQAVEISRFYQHFNQPMWDGALLQGRRILLHSEQGLGDALQFVRYVPQVVQRGGRVLFACPPSLLRLMQGLEQIEQFVTEGDPIPQFDVHCPLLSLPYLLDKTALTSIPQNVPYLKTDPDSIGYWRDRMAGTVHDGQLKVGLVWAGNPKPNPLRSIPPQLLAPLGDVPGVYFISLRKNASDAEMQAMPENLKLIDWTGELNDFADTAALIANLDLIITVDTAAAHLAGAMGKPTWTMLPFVPDWRWLLERDDSPWYPTMRLLRQPTAGNWQNVIRRAAQMLADRAIDPSR